jgi:hypothetical protein
MGISTGAQQDSRSPAPRFNEKGCLQVWGGDALNVFCRGSTIVIYILKSLVRRVITKFSSSMMLSVNCVLMEVHASVVHVVNSTSEPLWVWARISSSVYIIICPMCRIWGINRFVYQNQLSWMETMVCCCSASPQSCVGNLVGPRKATSSSDVSHSFVLSLWSF